LQIPCTDRDVICRHCRSIGDACLFVICLSVVDRVVILIVFVRLFTLVVLIRIYVFVLLFSFVLLVFINSARKLTIVDTVIMNISRSNEKSLNVVFASALDIGGE